MPDDALRRAAAALLAARDRANVADFKAALTALRAALAMPSPWEQVAARLLAAFDVTPGPWYDVRCRNLHGAARALVELRGMMEDGADACQTKR